MDTSAFEWKTPHPIDHFLLFCADLEFAVESDLPEVAGSPSVTVLAKSEVEYKLSMCPKFGGVFTGSVTFTAPGGIITWYTVEVRLKFSRSCQLASQLACRELRLTNGGSACWGFDTNSKGFLVRSFPACARVAVGASATLEIGPSARHWS